MAAARESGGALAHIPSPRGLEHMDVMPSDLDEAEAVLKASWVRHTPLDVAQALLEAEAYTDAEEDVPEPELHSGHDSRMLHIMKMVYAEALEWLASQTGAFYVPDAVIEKSSLYPLALKTAQEAMVDSVLTTWARADGDTAEVLPVVSHGITGLARLATRFSLLSAVMHYDLEQLASAHVQGGGGTAGMHAMDTQVQLDQRHTDRKSMEAAVGAAVVDATLARLHSGDTVRGVPVGTVRRLLRAVPVHCEGVVSKELLGSGMGAYAGPLYAEFMKCVACIGAPPGDGVPANKVRFHKQQCVECAVANLAQLLPRHGAPAPPTLREWSESLPALSYAQVSPMGGGLLRRP